MTTILYKMAELEYHNLDILSCIILTVIFGSVGIVIFLLFFKRNAESNEITENKSEKESSDSSDNDKNGQNVKKFTKQISQKKKAVKDCGATHPLLLASLKGHVGTIAGIDISSNGKLLGSCSEG